ncbi:hypothetical protein [Paenibacillus gansuensis]|uniref:MerR family transcriptional regulator n=1 Tax=Paenibacillus gansuensis TaxID=306542 RepID=A0ABW5PHF1_9BACL
MEFEKAWKITEFSNLIGKHHNTVDQWFKQLEEKRIHYVNRILGEKIYDALDLEIGQFIKEGRDKNYNLQMIFEQLPSIYEMRSFPVDWSTGDSQLVDIEGLKRMMEAQLQAAKAEMLKEVIGEAEKIFEEKQKLLPQPKSFEEQQADRVNDVMTRFKIERKLQEQAIQEWSALPESERMRKVGLFRKEEDWGKREAYIHRFVSENIENALKAEYGLNT